MTEAVSFAIVSYDIRRDVHDPLVDIPTQPLEDAVRGARVVVVATNHSAFSTPSTIARIQELAGPDCLIVDPWNALGSGQVFAYAAELAVLRPSSAAR